jgi:hypothetical protein
LLLTTLRAGPNSTAEGVAVSVTVKDAASLLFLSRLRKWQRLTSIEK